MACSVQCDSNAVFFYCDCVILHEFLLNGQMVNKEYYLKEMNRLREEKRRK
jgi:hypothetical protein